MFQKKFLTTFAALFLLLAGLFLLYHSNINETVFLDIAADNPIRVSADEQEEGIAVDENNDGSFTVSLPSTFLYQTKTVYFQNTGNEAVQLRLYSRQKKDGDNVVKFSIDVKTVSVNGKLYNSKKQTVWYERPYINTVSINKNEIFSLTVQYKTKFMLRNMYLPEFAIGIAILLFSITALFVCWREKIEELFFFKKLAEKFFQKYSVKINLINNYEWDTVIIKKYHAIDGVYRKTFWTVFIILNLVFLYYNVHFLWGNHDWYFVMNNGLWGQISWGNGRITNYWLYQLLGGRILPIVNVSFALFGFSFTGILLAYYWKVPKNIFNYLVLSLVVVLNPMVLYWLYFGLDVISHLWLPAIVILALIVSEKKSYFCFVIAYLLLIIGFGIYASGIATITAVLLGKIIIVYCFENHSILFLYQKFKRTFCCIALSLISFKILLSILMVLGLFQTDWYSNQMNLLGGSFENFCKLIKLSYENLIYTAPFYDNTIVSVLFGIIIFSFIVLCWHQKKYCAVKISQFCFIMAALCLFPLALNVSSFIYGKNLSDLRILFYGYIFLGAFCVGLLLKTKFVWAKNILIVFLIFLLPMNVYRLYDAQKLWKIEFEHENTMMERIVEKLQDSSDIQNQPYTIILFGEHQPFVLSFYKEPFISADNFIMGHSSFEHYALSGFIKFYHPEFKAKEVITFFVNGTIFTYGNKEKIDPFQELLPYYDMLRKEMAQWPSSNSVLVKDNYLFINFDNEVLNAVFNAMEEKYMENK